jgi:hypothetical protein
MGRSFKAAVARWKRVARTDEGAWRPAVKNISQANPLSWKPQVWLGAVLAAVVPIAAVTWKTYRSNPSVALAPQVSQRQSQSTDSALTKSSDGVAESSSQVNSFAGIQAWFEGSANPFLTTAQANDRKVRDALAKVEASLRRRGDVEDIFILVSEGAEKNTGAMFLAKNSANAGKSSDAIDAPVRKPKAVVSIRMRTGSLPIALADCAGSLVSAALVNVNAEDVEVIDARDGARVRARSLDFNASAQGREALAVTAQCEEQEIQDELRQTEASTLLDQSNQIEDGLAHRFNSPTNHSAQEVADPSVSGKNNSPLLLIHSSDATNAAMGWWWCVTAIGVVVAGLAVWTWKKFLSPSVRSFWKKSATSSIDHCNNHLRAATNNSAGPASMSTLEIWSAPLSCALHACVAEKPALIAATLIERLESQPSSRQEVARLMLELEPWAAERILAVLPNHSLDILEKSIKQPATAVTPQQVRALAEAMISLRNAA